jgi:ribokinase
VINSINQQTHTVTFPYPSKVQLTTPPHTGGGGNAYNASHALQKLGLSTAIYTIVGTDHEGNLLIEDLKTAGINTDMIVQDQSRATNSSFIMSISGDKVLFSHHFQRDYKLPELPETKYVYLTSIGEDDKPLFDDVVAQKKAKGFKLLFSPGTHQVTEPLSDIRELLQNTDILIVNKEEAKKLSRLNTESSETLAKALHDMGPGMVIVTRSQHGSIGFDGTNFVKVGALPVDTVECTGAGDTYAATMVAGLALQKDLKTAMEWGAINAANVITQIGCVYGLLDMSTLQQKYQSNAASLKYVEPQTAVPSSTK